MEASVSNGSDLDVVIQASRNIEGALMAERANLQKTRAQLSEVQGAYGKLLKESNERIKEFNLKEQRYKNELQTARENELGAKKSDQKTRENETSLIAQIRALTRENEKFREELEAQRRDSTERERKMGFEMELSKSALEYVNQRTKYYEQALEELKQRHDKLGQEMDRRLHESLEIENELRAKLAGHQTYDKSNTQALTIAKDRISKAEEELSRFRTAWSEVQSMRTMYDGIMNQASKREARLRELEVKISESTHNLQLESEKSQRAMAEAEKHRLEK
ncbi:MAG: hypothetical protein AAB425_02040, partial [Bdellovibrionota bacterium]